MKAFAWAVLALMAACLGCAQGGSKAGDNNTAGRLQNLETNFAKFQEQERLSQQQRQARDADIDNKLNQIATRLDSLAPGAKSARASQPAKPVKTASGGSGQQLVAGQVIPLSSLGAPASVTPAPVPAQPAQAPQASPAPQSSAQAAPPQAYASGVQGAAPKPLGQSTQPFGKPVPGQVQPLQAAAPATPASAPAAAGKDPLGLEPPVVTLNPQQASPSASPQPLAVAQPQPAGSQAKRPTPYDGAAKPPKGKGRAVSASSAPSAMGAAAQAAEAPAAPAAASAPSGQDDPVEAAQLYTDAMRAITAGKNDDGRRKLNDLLTKYPNAEKAPLALYWVGESYMNDRSYNQAILAYKDVTTRYPKSFKAPESVYKVAEAYERLGDKSNAVFHLKLLVDEYPGSELAGKARQKLKQLGQ